MRNSSAAEMYASTVMQLSTYKVENLRNSEVFSSPDCLQSFVYLFICKLSQFSFSSLKPQGQFQSNFEQSIFGQRGFESHALFQGEIMVKSIFTTLKDLFL